MREEPLNEPSYTYRKAEYPYALRRVLWFDVWRKIPTNKVRIGDRLPTYYTGKPTGCVVVSVSDDTFSWAYEHQITGLH